MPNTIADLNKRISDKKCTGLFVFYGEEDALKTHKINTIKKQLLDEVTQDFNFIKFEGNNINTDAVTDAFESYPVMAEYKMVLFKDTGIFKSAKQDIKTFFESRFKDIPDYLCVIFDEKEIDKRSSLYKSACKAGMELEFKYLTDTELAAWVQRIFSEHKLIIDKKDAVYLVNVCEPGMNSIKQELDKLLNYSKDVVTKSDIDTVVSKSLQMVVFDLTEAIMQNNKAKAFEILEGLKTIKTEPFKLLYLIFSTFEKILLAKLVLDERGTVSQVAARLKLSPYIARKYCDCSTRFSESFLKSAIVKCADIDMEIKTGKKNEWIALEQYIIHLLNI